MTGGESIEHHLLKLELAQAARAAGFHAEYEVLAPDGSWRADVMATSTDGTRRVALEAQLSSITCESIQARTNRYERDGIAVCWFGVTPRPWVGSVPSLLLSSPDHDRSGWIVSAGIARMSKLDPKSSFQQWVPVENVRLIEAVAWIVSGKMRPHRPLSFAKTVVDTDSQKWPAGWISSSLDKWHVWWTTSRHIDADAQQDRDHYEKTKIAILRAESPISAFRARTKIENITKLENLILKQFNNNATRSRADFHIRVDPRYADGLAFYGYRWQGYGTIRDKKPFVVVCPDISGDWRWEDDVLVAFPVDCRDRLSGIKNLWLFDLDKNSIWPAEPKGSAVYSAQASWRSVEKSNTTRADSRLSPE
ncbi:competence protein CoiA family protein [Streptomyces tendae]